MSTDLAPLLVRWLTHDLATPIATVMTASELLGEVNDPEINELITAGAKRLAARLRLIRSALAPGESPVGGSAFRKLITEGVDNPPISWDIPADWDGAHAPVIAGAALLLADLRRGQGLVITPASVRWATPAEFSPTVAAALGGGAAVDPRAALAAMLHAAAGRAGLAITVLPDGIAWR